MRPPYACGGGRQRVLLSRQGSAPRSTSTNSDHRKSTVRCESPRYRSNIRAPSCVANRSCTRRDESLRFRLNYRSMFYRDPVMFRCTASTSADAPFPGSGRSIRFWSPLRTNECTVCVPYPRRWRSPICMPTPTDGTPIRMISTFQTRTTITNARQPGPLLHYRKQRRSGQRKPSRRF